jgi:acyl-CoA thioester hydrolase
VSELRRDAVRSSLRDVQRAAPKEVPGRRPSARRSGRLRAIAYVHPLRVRFGECDPQGIVFNANYLAFIDVALTELMRDAFGSYAQMITDHAADLVVAEATQRFLSPARGDDLLDITLSFPHLGTTSTTMAVAVTRGGESIMDAEVRYVFVDPQTGAKTPIPERIRAILAEV